MFSMRRVKPSLDNLVDDMDKISRQNDGTLYFFFPQIINFDISCKLFLLD